MTTCLQTGSILLLWLMPSLFWQGEPITERNHHDRQGQQQMDQKRQDSLIEQALRRNFSPNGILRIIMINTVIVSEYYESLCKYRVFHQLTEWGKVGLVLGCSTTLKNCHFCQSLISRRNQANSGNFHGQNQHNNRDPRAG